MTAKLTNATVTYWLAALVVTAIGVVGGFTLGLWVVPAGIAMLVLGPFRRRALVFWPALLGVVGFVAALAALAPMTCERTSATNASETTVCSNMLGWTWRGDGAYVLPPEADRDAFVVGLVVGGATAVAVSGVLLARRRAGQAPRVPFGDAD